MCVPIILSCFFLIRPIPIANLLIQIWHPFPRFNPFGFIQFHAALEQRCINGVCSVNRIIQINLIGVAHCIDQRQGVGALRQFFAFRVQDDGVVHNPVRVIPFAGLINHFGCRLRFLVCPLLGLAAGTDLHIIQRHFGGIDQRLLLCLVFRIRNFAVHCKRELRPCREHTAPCRGLNIQRNDIVFVCSADIVLVGGIRSGNDFSAHRQFHIEVFRAAKLEAFQRHTFWQSISQRQLMFIFANCGLNVPGHSSIAGNLRRSCAAIPIRLNHAGIIIPVLAAGFPVPNFDIIIENVFSRRCLGQIHRGGISKGQFCSPLRGRNIFREVNVKKCISQLFKIHFALIGRSFIFADLLIGIGGSIGGQEGHLLRWRIISVRTSQMISALIRPYQVRGPGRNLAAGHPLVGIHIAVLILGHIVHNGCPCGQTRTGDRQRYRPGNGGGFPILGNLGASHVFGNGTFRRNGHLLGGINILAVQSQTGIVPDRLIIPFPLCLRGIGNEILTGVGACLSDRVEDDIFNFSIVICVDVIMAIPGKNRPPVSVINRDVSDGQGVEHCILKLRSCNIVTAFVDGNRPFDFVTAVVKPPVLCQA